MRITHPARPQLLLGQLESARDFLRRLNVVDFDIYYADAQADARVNLAERLQVGRGPVRQLEHEMVGP